MESNGSSMESKGSRVIILSKKSRKNKSKKPRSKSMKKGNPTTLRGFEDVSKHVASFLHPADTVALRQTSRAFRDAVERHPTKQNALRVLAKHRPENMIPVWQNRLIMETSGRQYMKHDQARKYLEKMFTHRGYGNIFRKNALVFPGMYYATPTPYQRWALARAITSDHSKEGVEFMYKLIQKIRSRRHGLASKVHVISPRSLASMYRTQGPGRRKIL